MSKVKKYIYYVLMGLIFLLGIYLRTKLYLGKGVFEDDECRLAFSMFSLNIWQMFGPLGPWSSSPIFMFVSKIIAHFTHYNEFALEFLPYVFSLTSIFVFFKLTEEYFERKVVKLLANYFFAINAQFLFFTPTFKQYSLEVLMGLLCLYYLPKINILELTKKQLCIFIAIIAILPLISIPSLFYIGAFVLINIFIHWKDKKELFKKFLIIAIPFLIVFALYYIFNLAPTKALQERIYGDYWSGFYAFKNIAPVAGHLRYAFQPNMYVLCLIILLLNTVIITIFDKSKNKLLGYYMILAYLLVHIASILNIYPCMSRTGLHIIPALILLTLKSIDTLSVKKPIFYISLLLVSVGFAKYFTIPFFSDIHAGYVYYAPDKIMNIITEKFNEKTDKVALDEASLSSYIFYAKKNNFDVMSKIFFIKYDPENVRKDVFNSLNNMDKNKHYWFYLIKEYDDMQRQNIIEWINQQPNVKYAGIIRNSYVFYIEPPYKTIEP